MRVLLAEDDGPLRLLYELWLDEAGFEVTAVADGRAALAELDAGRLPDLAVLDVAMPFVDGLEVCRRLRARSTVLPIVLETALDGIGRDAVTAGADRVIEKPGSREELLGPLVDLLERRSAA